MINYITHLNAAFNRFCNDERLTPFHISLYFALFHFWNAAKFRTPISINREETMAAARIGSANTYTRCLKELNAWGYIRYEPSFSPLVGSKIHLYTFSKTTDKTINNGTDISTDKSTGKASEKVLRPSIKTKTNKLNHKKNEHIRSKGSEKSVSLHRSKTSKGKKRKVAPKEKESRSPRADPGCERPLLHQVKKYFSEKGWSNLEAEKFFNYYQSNGWLIGGKTPMRSWKAASKNWMINSEKFSNNGPKSGVEKEAGRLSSKQDKNYAEPL